MASTPEVDPSLCGSLVWVRSSRSGSRQSSWFPRMASYALSYASVALLSEWIRQSGLARFLDARSVSIDRRARSYPGMPSAVSGQRRYAVG